MHEHDPQGDPQAASTNRRTTWLILGFAALSLGASVLPLLPDIGSWLPFEWLSRRGALVLYATFIVAYMGLVFPASLLIPRGAEGGPDHHRRILGWWWVGVFILAFSGVPLFVLAYIAGVSLKSMLTVLMWAGFFHGLACLWPRCFGSRTRPLLLSANFLALVILPFAERFNELLGGAAAGATPMVRIVAMTRDFAAPDLVTPALLVIGSYGLLWFLCCGRVGRKVASGAVLLALVSLFAFRAPPGGADSSVQETEAKVTALTGGLWRPGRTFPLKLEAPAGETLVVDCGEKQHWTWTPEPGEGSLWCYVTPRRQQDVVRVTRNGGEVARFTLDLPRPGEHLVLFLGSLPRVMRPGLRSISWATPDELTSPLAYEPFGAVVCAEGLWQGLAAPARKALESWLHEGGTLILSGSLKDELTVRGRGTLVRTRSGALPDGINLKTSGEEHSEANLYSNFSLPDWGDVDLTGLLLFLAVYHAVFYFIFLLPLIFDARKAPGVYLISVGFVLTLVVGGAYLVLKRHFLAENQVLQQNLCVWRWVPGEQAGPAQPRLEQPRLVLHQASCFASFNGNPVSLAFALEESPRPAPPAAPGTDVSVSFAARGQQMVLENLKLDRFAGKQIVKLTAGTAAPFVVKREGDVLRLAPIPGRPDVFGLLTARRVAAFARREGRLFPVALDGDRMRISSQSAPQAWQGVLPASLRERNLVPFLRHVLGRHTNRREAVLVLILEGAQGLHDHQGYLARRDILQVLILNLDGN